MVWRLMRVISANADDDRQLERDESDRRFTTTTTRTDDRLPPHLAMADLLYELLAADSPGTSIPSAAANPDALAYLASLASRPLSSLQSEEPLSLSQSSHSTQLALQGLAKKSYQPVLESAKRHEVLKTAVPDLVASAAELRKSIPSLDDEVVRFSTTYRGTGHNSSLSTAFGASGSASSSLGITNSRRVAKGPSGKASASGKPDLIARRRQALLLSRNVERLVDVLELPPLLASSVATAPVNYASALDLNGHIRRLYALYPDSPLVKSVAVEAEESMRATAASLVLSLKAPSLKLAASLRTISWLRRVLPDIEAAALAAQPSKGTSPAHSQHDLVAQERALGALFLVCRLSTLTTMLDALAPLRELADQERSRQRTASSSNTWSGGQQTERYLKRYIEIFREQSFAIVSMFRSIFPETSTPSSINTSHNGDSSSDGYTPTSSISGAASSTSANFNAQHDDPLETLPSALSTFPLHLVDMLLDTLRDYLPTVRDQASRDSLLTQVLYCAGSLGRLGGDFGLFLATLDVGEDAEAEWVEVVRRHRQLAGRLESIVGDPLKK